MPAKPGKYGLKIYAVVDSDTFYTYNLELYTKEQPEGPYRASNAAESVVLRLVEDLTNTGRTITTDNYFTSLNLADQLFQRNLFLLGTLRKNKPFIPSKFLQISEFGERPRYASIFGFTKTATLVSYCNKKRKIIPLLSTAPVHNDESTSTSVEKKPRIILDYNRWKSGVDVVDHMRKNYSVQRISCRWPLTVFYTLLNVATINAQVLYTINRGEIRRREFIKSIAKSLVTEQARRRVNTDQVELIIRQRISEVFRAPLLEAETKEGGRCFMCDRKKNRFSKTACAKCERYICTEHRRTVCIKCAPPIL